MNEDGTSVVTPVQRTSMTLQLQQPSISAPSPQVQQNVESCVLVVMSLGEDQSNYSFFRLNVILNILKVTTSSPLK